ncbi:hypothetical protein CLV58_101184 [Spirosoma oryzae]|uniref:DUF5977 domain-containing protein n=1 Tax=Spirosoma oryzae TaxID=1469603 RepID=A0A2T0TNL0_9BACT|nr:DUF5977 domain-containing protein [Spirosoma oryzae]PRY47118.1 hypothetical protein CLV58_101184 [Spirosoma oryzae]
MIDALKADVVFLPLLLSRNRIEPIIEPADPSLADRTGLRYFLDISIPSFPLSPTFAKLLTMPGSEKPPLANGSASVYEGAYFRIDELLNEVLERQKPDFAQTGLSVIASLTMPFQLAESIQNNGVLIPGTNVTRPKQWLIKAGLSEADFAGWGSRFFDQWFTRSWLTWQPDGKTVGASSEEYLYFLLNQTPNPAQVVRRVEVNYADGTSEVLDRGSLTGVGLYQVVCMPVGPKALGLDTLGKPVISYEVWLSDGNQYRLSETRLYRLDTQYRRQERQILFCNSLGGWDTIRLLGEGFETLKTSRTSAEVERPFGAGADFSSAKLVYLEGERQLQISTGWLERNARQTLRTFDELMLAESVYLITDKGHIPLELVTNSLIDAEDASGLVSRTFIFRQTELETSYSDLPAAPVTSARATGWRGVGIVQTLDANGKRTGRGRPLRLQRYYLDDKTPYKPRTEKPNVQGDPDFIADAVIPGGVAGSTPYPNAAISRPTSYTRTNCGAGVGGPAIVSIPAGTYGGERPGDGDELAEAQYRASNTQEFANLNGTCTVQPELYNVAIPAGLWHYRAADPSRVALHFWGGDPATGTPNQSGGVEPDLGNIWTVQGTDRPYVFPVGSNDLDFPPKTADWRFMVYGPVSGLGNVKIWRNGVSVMNLDFAFNLEGSEYFAFPVTPSAGDKYYFLVTTR